MATPDASDPFFKLQASALDANSKLVLNRIAELKARRAELQSALQDQQAERMKFLEHAELMKNRSVEIAQGVVHKKKRLEFYHRAVASTKERYDGVLLALKTMATCLDQDLATAGA